MDQAIRNKLRNVVTQCRRLLEEAVSQVLQGQFGVYASGNKGEIQVEDAARMEHLSEEDRGYREQVLVHYGHIQARGFKPTDALDQLIREVAFTHLNRLCAYKMMEKRGLIREAVSRGLKSQGFLFYLADNPEDERRATGGEQDLAYKHFLQWLGKTLSQEIGVLFSPSDPANRLFPPQRILDKVLGLLNGEDLEAIWSEDETIGWVYQYFTPKELREQVRKESQAPRNSNELAFRNQFFTPRYVVEFLTDNTLGRLWYEMRKGQTRLKHVCRYLVCRPTEVFLAEGDASYHGSTESSTKFSQDDLLWQPVCVPHRDKKDPREIKVLDPACGSGHFLLYCFGLLVVIYEESYNDAELGPALRREYATPEEYRKAIPGLILSFNLHGIDIDPRAVQIAGLALWLRAQRAYQDLGLKKNERPQIDKTCLVCAEPLPGEQKIFDDFLRDLDEVALSNVLYEEFSIDLKESLDDVSLWLGDVKAWVNCVWVDMRRADETGSLLQMLRILVHVKKRIRDFHEYYNNRPLLRMKLGPLLDWPEDRFDRLGLKIVVSLLRKFINEEVPENAMPEILFREDTARGIVFLEINLTDFCVVLMNPPFGAPSKLGKPYLEKFYPRTKSDMYAAFVERGLSFLYPGGMLGAITSRSGFFLTSFQKWREEILLEEATPTAFADLGYGVLDSAMVETAAYCLRKG